MTREKFRANILEQVKKCPLNWRKGQAVFNVVDAVYGVARTVQFNKNIDCFNDSSKEKIDAFIDASYDVYEEMQNHTIHCEQRSNQESN